MISYHIISYDFYDMTMICLRLYLDLDHNWDMLWQNFFRIEVVNHTSYTQIWTSKGGARNFPTVGTFFFFLKCWGATMWNLLKICLNKNIFYHDNTQKSYHVEQNQPCQLMLCVTIWIEGQIWIQPTSCVRTLPLGQSWPIFGVNACKKPKVQPILLLLYKPLEVVPHTKSWYYYCSNLFHPHPYHQLGWTWFRQLGWTWELVVFGWTKLFGPSRQVCCVRSTWAFGLRSNWSERPRKMTSWVTELESKVQRLKSKPKVAPTWFTYVFKEPFGARWLCFHQIQHQSSPAVSCLKARPGVILLPCHRLENECGALCQPWVRAPDAKLWNGQRPFALLDMMLDGKQHDSEQFPYRLVACYLEILWMMW